MQGSPYSSLQRLFHQLVLGPAVVRQLSFDLERQFSLPNRQEISPDPADGAVYVCGLARSGTTILLRVLEQVDVFRSLTYRDMPFVLAPNIWNRLAKYAKLQMMGVERPHGDGIKVDFDSPEAFEEVFWRTVGQQTITKQFIRSEEPTPDVLAAFADYRALIANPKTKSTHIARVPKRYLSKNNNNLMRLSGLCSDQTSRVLLVYRDPKETAISLYRQHLHFSSSQRGDHFTRRYMNWLGHYEFGLDHKPFEFCFKNMDMTLSSSEPNYWLDYWDAVYRYVLSMPDLPITLVSHAELCSNPLKYLEMLFSTLNIHADVAPLAMQITRKDSVSLTTCVFSPEILNRTRATYDELVASPKNITYQP